MNVKKITIIVNGLNFDRVYLETDTPSPLVGVNGPLSLGFEADGGEEYWQQKADGNFF